MLIWMMGINANERIKTEEIRAIASEWTPKDGKTKTLVERYFTNWHRENNHKIGE